MNDLKFRRLDNRASATLHRLVVSEVINNSDSILQKIDQKEA